jgi:hypothetical protein
MNYITVAPSGSITVTLVTPTSGPVGTPVQIGGSGFVSGATVKIGTVTASSSVISSSIISAIVPTMSPGTYAVTVTNPDGSTGTLSNAFTVTVVSVPALVSSIAPSSRVAQVGTPVTLMMAVVNGGTDTARDVVVQQHTTLPVNLVYYSYDVATRTWNLNTPATIIPTDAAFFVVAMTPTSAFPASSMTFDVKTTNGTIVFAPIERVNTFTLAATNGPSADIVMVSTVTDVSATVNVGGVFAIATSNVGNAAAADVSLVIDTGTMPLSVQGKQIDPTTGAIIGDAQHMAIAIGGTPNFAVFYTATAAIANDPGNNRILIKLVDGSGNVLGSQSVSIHT